MTSERSVAGAAHLSLFADACLITAGVFAASAAVSAPIALLLQRTGGQVSEIAQGLVSLAFTLSALLVGPILTWRLHGNRLNVRAALGMFLGFLASGAVAALIPAVMIGVVRPLWPGGSEVVSLFVLVGVMGVLFLAMFAAQTAAALRDLRGERANVRLDRVRLVAAGIVAVFALVVVGIIVLAPQSEGGEALPFAMLFALAGGLLAAGADVLTSLGGRRPPEHRETISAA